MSQIRFHHVFIVLMFLSALCAFVLPPTFTRRATPNVASLFYPVSRPAHLVARWASGRFGAEYAQDKRTVQDVRAENAELRAMVSTLEIQLGRERARDAQWRKLASLREQGVLVQTVGGDAGTRQTLQMRGAGAHRVREGFAVYPGGVVGAVQRSGAAGMQIRLVTDPGFRIRAGFARLRKGANGKLELVRIATPPVLVEGVGDNTLRISRGLTMEDLKNAELNQNLERDPVWAFVDDGDWPDLLQGHPIGQVEKITESRTAPLFAEVTLRPSTNLMRLREVLVVGKE